MLDTGDGALLFVKPIDRQLFTAEHTIQGHRIRFLSVDLSVPTAEIRARWLQYIDDTDLPHVI